MPYVNLRGLWKMEEAAGTLLDDSGEGNGLTGTWAQSSTHVRGSWAAQFTGTKVSRTDASLSVNFPCKIGYAPTALTFGAWLRPSSITGSRMYCINKGSEYFLDFDTDDRIRFQCRNGGLFPDVQSDVVAVAGSWYHVACRANTANGVMDMFVNAALQTDSGFKGLTTLAAVSDPFVIGGQTGAGSEYSGYADEAFMFDTVVSNLEIGQIHSGQFFGDAPPPLVTVGGNMNSMVRFQTVW
jgi:hypothetical protein